MITRKMYEKMRWRRNVYTKNCIEEKMNGRKKSDESLAPTKKMRNKKIAGRKYGYTKICGRKKCIRKNVRRKSVVELSTGVPSVSWPRFAYWRLCNTNGSTTCTVVTLIWRSTDIRKSIENLRNQRNKWNKCYNLTFFIWCIALCCKMTRQTLVYFES